MDPVVKRRILDMIEREGLVRSADFQPRIEAEVPEREITLDKARRAVANGYASAIKRAKDPIGRMLIVSVKRDDGWYLVTSGRYGPVENQLVRAQHVMRRDSAERAIERTDRLGAALEQADCTLVELPAEVWEAIVS